MIIKTGSEVTLQYILRYDDGEGEIIEETTPNEPLEFTVGKQEMLDSFEGNLKNLKEGDDFSFVLAPEESYGPFQEELMVEYQKEDFIVDGELDEEFLQEGEIIEMKDDEGNVFEGIIEENRKNTVLVNFNHPLAGETLHFTGSITKIS